MLDIRGEGGENLVVNAGFDDPLEAPGRMVTNQGNGYGNLESVGEKSPGGDTIQQLTGWEIVVQEETAQEDGTPLKSYENSFFFTVPNSNISKCSANSRESKNQRIALVSPAPGSEANVVYVPKRLRQRVSVPEKGVYQISFWHGPGGTRNANSWADSTVTIEVGGQIVFTRRFQHILKANDSVDAWKKVWSEPFELETGEYDLDIYSQQAEPFQSGITGIDTIDDLQFGLYGQNLEILTEKCSVKDYSGPISVSDGEVCTLLAIPDEGCYFMGWEGNGITDENRYANPLTLTVPDGGADLHLFAKAVATNANLLANADFELVYGGKEGAVIGNRVKRILGLEYPYGTFAGWAATGPGNGYGEVCWVILGGNPVGSSTASNSFELGLVASDTDADGNGLEQTFYAPVDGNYTLTLNLRSLNYSNYTNGQVIPIYLDGQKAAQIERELDTDTTTETVELKRLKAGPTPSS
ncbi:MAG: hypothetical protein ACI4QD_07680 [Kiritimatiellia bacterium]